MELRAGRVMLLTLSVGWVACAPAEPAAAPEPVAANAERDDGAEQRALEQRRLQLENQVLAELRKLRERRQASTAAEEPAAEEPGSGADCELLVFGGVSHEVFLGCLSDERKADSVFNLAGEHGSDLSPVSIRNKFAPYGSNHDDTSACNVAANRPPVIVASNGKSLGLLTLNTNLKRRIRAPSVADWLARMCGI
jgi:hypothetical protein